MISSERFEVAVRPDVGGSIASFRHINGEPVFRDAVRSDYIDARDSGCFPLVPFSNRVRRRRFHFEGRQIHLNPNVPEQDCAAHGHGWNQAWQVQYRDRSCVMMSYDWPGDDWPWPYRAWQKIAVTDAGLRVELTLENRGPSEMPAGLGLHPYLPMAPDMQLQFDARAHYAVDSDGFPTPGQAGPRALDDFRRGAAVPASAAYFTGRTGAIRVRYPHARRMLELQCCAVANCLVIYPRPDLGFVCVEPVTHQVGAMEPASGTPYSIGVLAPGAAMECTFDFTMTIG